MREKKEDDRGEEKLVHFLFSSRYRYTFHVSVVSLPGCDAEGNKTRGLVIRTI